MLTTSAKEQEQEESVSSFRNNRKEQKSPAKSYSISVDPGFTGDSSLQEMGQQQFAGKAPEHIQRMADNSSHAQEAMTVQGMVNNSSQAREAVVVQRMAGESEQGQGASAVQGMVADNSRTVVQRKIQMIGGRDTGNEASIHKIASAGVQGNGSKIPYHNKIQKSFGPDHDVSAIQAYTGTKASTASRAMGAKAYAAGNKIAFVDGNPDIHTVAHEAAHTIQQRAGVQLKGGLGQEGDPYEQQADAVADAVKQGKSARHLLPLNHGQVSFRDRSGTKKNNR